MHANSSTIVQLQSKNKNKSQKGKLYPKRNSELRSNLQKVRGELRNERKKVDLVKKKKISPLYTNRKAT